MVAFTSSSFVIVKTLCTDTAHTSVKQGFIVVVFLGRGEEGGGHCFFGGVHCFLFGFIFLEVRGGSFFFGWVVFFSGDEQSVEV